ncbi:MAG: acyl carrier protein [Planctomycetota bacterium]
MTADRRDTVLEVLALVSGHERDAITDDQDLVADLGLDSPKAVRLLVELEERFDVEIPDDAASGLSTVADLLRLAETYG